MDVGYLSGHETSLHSFPNRPHRRLLSSELKALRKQFEEHTDCGQRTRGGVTARRVGTTSSLVGAADGMLRRTLPRACGVGGRWPTPGLHGSVRREGARGRRGKNRTRENHGAWEAAGALEIAQWGFHRDSQTGCAGPGTRDPLLRACTWTNVSSSD